MSDWELLGIKKTSDVSEIKKAFAKKLKTCRPEDNAELYQELRNAYERIIKQAKRRARKNSVSSVPEEAPSEKYDAEDFKKAQKELKETAKRKASGKKINKTEVELETENLQTASEVKSSIPKIDQDELKRIQQELENQNAVSLEEAFPPLPLFEIPEWSHPYVFDPLRTYTFN